MAVTGPITAKTVGALGSASTASGEPGAKIAKEPASVSTAGFV